MSSSNFDSQDLSIKDQYRRLGRAIKADSRFCWWTGYCLLLVFGWGYDNGLSGVAIAFPAFRESYGHYYPEATTSGEEYVIPALWQSLWNAASTIGQVFGGYAAGQFADTFGRKAILYLAVFLSLASSFALVFAPNLPILFVSKLLLGLSIGLSTATPPLYVTENAPAHLRSTVASLTNVIIVLGFFMSSITGFGSSHIQGVWSYRLAFVLTFLIPGIYLIGLPFFPESPVWYMKKDREEDARKALVKLYGSKVDIEGRLQMIRDELKQNEAPTDGISQTSWKAIFSRENRIRTFVAVLGLQVQNFSGGYFANTYQTYYFGLIGAKDPFQLTAISSTLQFVANCAAVVVADVVPRRKGLIGGGTILLFWSVIIAGTSLAPKDNHVANVVNLAFMITWSMGYTATVGCYGWAVAAETSSQATRPKTISFVLVCQQLTALLLSSVFPFFINPDQLNWGGKVMFLFVGAEIFILAALFWFQGETKNRTNTEMDALYASGVPKWRFTQYRVVDSHVELKEKTKGSLVGRMLRKA
ncbi:general substrate transporter [Pseudovirgaria hyperparasitica]|uniref:General substrate transporter n=1 Tax=Pseudovirgaria hyperparasitica TaxID=470096 RepID=A0A6A6W4V2_9PEZI|nr:general substrate transporter [Pseudovirgaria hyperparasitica]KAF2757585.1 general substrate transporter [Pseudovirgaria hyperparasitica]